MRKNSTRVADAYKRAEDTIVKQFEKQNLVWPPAEVYIRSFKFDRQLEVWVKGKETEPFKLFKTYWAV